MTHAEAKNLRTMKGKLVEISWRNPEDDWPYFLLLEVSEKDSTIKLRGMDFPDGSVKHEGDEFWADWADVTNIEPVMGMRSWAADGRSTLANRLTFGAGRLSQA